MEGNGGAGFWGGGGGEGYGIRVIKVSLFHIFLNLELLFCEIYDCKE